MSNDVYYRPPWTCGKYNADKHVAIMFNLIEGFDYFFEKEAADIIGLILSVGKNGMISASKVSDNMQIVLPSINGFFGKLVKYGLLSQVPISESIITEYKNICKKKKKRTIGKTEEFFRKKDLNELSSAEDAYDKAVMNYNTITSVMFELTYRCSENCIHCYNPGATRNDKETSTRASLIELTINDYKRIIDELCDAGLVVANISGGDPFSYHYVWEIIEYLYQKDVATKIFTNGQRLDGNIAKLAKYYPRDVKISVYSGVASIHDGITRVKGSLDKTLSVIEQLVNHSIGVTINCPIMTRNVQSYSTVKEIGKKYNCNVVFDVTIIDSIDGDICASQCLRLPPQILEVVLQDKSVGGYVSMDDSVSINGYGIDLRDGVPCDAGVSLFCITPDGDLTPCNSMHMTIGNLKFQHFSDIIQTSKKLLEWRSMKHSQFLECWSHDYCSYCHFCIGNNYSEHGTPFKAGENNCYIAKVRYALAQKMKSNNSVTNTIDDFNYKDSELHRQYREGKMKPL